MTPISNFNTGTAQSMTAAEKVLQAQKVQKVEEEGRDRPLKPVTDEYIQSEKQEMSGRYWLGKDKDRQIKIYFDDPERTVNPPESQENMDRPDYDKGVKKVEGNGKKEERCVGNTDKVDREIEKLKKKQQELKQRLSTETDEAKRKDLERQLTQIKHELSEKDNDTYRRQHATFTKLS